MSPTISVVICTLNRVELVCRAVYSVIDQDLAVGDFEIVVVDNGSSDGTREVIGAIARVQPNLRVVHEPVRGLSNARNRGVREASAPLVAFLDDDAVAVRGWLAAHLRALTNSEDIVATGGPVLLRWPGRRPSWLPPERESFYSGLDMGTESCRMVFPTFPYGANMALRRDAFERVGGFSPWLGRRGKSLLSGEESELFRRLSELGGRFTYVPEAVVHHYVLPERARRGWLLRRSFAQGRSEVIVASATSRPKGFVGSVGRAAIRSGIGLGRLLAVVPAALRGHPPEEAMRHASRGVQSLGAAWEYAAEALRVAGDKQRLAGHRTTGWRNGRSG